MLRPRDTITRETKRLDGMWSFTADVDGVGRDEGWWRCALPDATGMPVPSSFNDVFVGPRLHDHVGDVWYQRHVFVPRGWAGQRVVLRFDAATHRAVAWVGDTRVAEHEGGYTPFEADITALAEAGEALRLTVVVNNELTWQSLPPGTVEVMPTGVRRQRQYHDFFNYAGLHRSVWLYSTPRTYVDDITVVTDFDGDMGVVGYAAGVAGPDTTTVQVALRDADGREVAHTTGAGGELRVPEPELWRPGRGYLYELQVDLLDEGALVDRYTLPVGIRTVRVDGTQFLLNGEPFYFRGFGKHEDLNVHGRGHDDVAMVHDFSLLSWIGANSFRTSHYPYAEEVLDHADRLGIVVIDETAAVGLNLGVGGGLFLGGPKTTYSEETIGSATQEAHQQAIEELIARDKNHPCVVLWSLANEPESHTEAAHDYFEPLFATRETRRPQPPGRLRQHDVRAPRHLHGHRDGGRRHDQPLLRMVRRARRPRRRRERPGGRAGGVGQPAPQAHHRHRVRRRHARRPPHDGRRPCGARSTRRHCSRRTTVCSTGWMPSSGSTCGTSRTSRPDLPSCASTATRRECSPGIGARRWPPTSCGGAGSVSAHRTGRVPDDELPDQLLRRGLLAQHRHGNGPGLACRQPDGGERGCHHGGHRHVVEADDADVARDGGPPSGSGRR